MSEQPVPVRDQTLNDSRLLPPAVQPHVTLSSPPNSAIATTVPLAKRDDTAQPQEHLGRFEVYGEIGRGGMGAVLRGRDPALGRDLALKVLLAGREGNADALRRFHEEAQIGGQLQHPGLVPVYELGADDDGRPFFAMKLVDGQTLGALLKERTNPADKLPRFLTIFEQVCQALGYAHARGVIHRDLKPANVMVGAFGEVQVMDWGLAKVFTRNEPEADVSQTAAEPATLLTARSAAHEPLTATDAIMGTPSYMAPEQARGHVGGLDARADVFALGAILSAILTGQPPFAGSDVNEILQRAARGDLAEAFDRLEGCGADAELVRLAKACLAAKPEDRPRDGSAVATQVAAYRAGVEERLRRAELERAATEARAVEERRRRRVQLALVGAVLLLLTLSVGGGWYLRQQQTERRLERAAVQARQETERVRQEAVLLRAIEDDLNRLARAQEDHKWEEAWALLERVEGRLEQDGVNDLRPRVRRVRDDLTQVRKDQQMKGKLDEARMQMVSAGRDGFDYEGGRKLFQEAFTWYGVDVLQAPPDEVTAMLSQSHIREDLVIALDNWSEAALLKDEKRLRAVANEVDLNTWRRQLRGAIQQRDDGLLRRLTETAVVSELPPASIIVMANALRRAKTPERALALLREGRQCYPADFWINLVLAYTLFDASPSQVGEAVRYYTAAQAIRPDSALVLYNLGIALHKQGKLPEAIAAYRESIRFKPDYPEAYCNLGFVLREQGMFAASMDAFRRGNELGTRSLEWRYPSDQWFRAAERLVELDRRLPDVLAGKDTPADAQEQIEFARVCVLKRRHAAATRFSTAAFKTDVSLADDLSKVYRYNAACVASLALAGDDEGGPPSGEELVRFRKQAMGWLRDDLVAWGKRLDGGKPEDLALVARTMRYWQKDADLAAVRDADALAKLPETERAEWQKLWRDVETLLKRAGATK